MEDGFSGIFDECGNNTTAALIPTAFFWLLFAVSMLTDMRRCRNGILILLLPGLIVGTGELALLAFLLDAGPAVGSMQLRPAAISLSVIYGALVFISFMLYSLFVNIRPHRRDYDYIIIHGCGLLDGSRVSRLLSERLDKAVQVYDECRAQGAGRAGRAECAGGSARGPVLVPSGGRGSDEAIPEAEAMRDYLIGKGVPGCDIMPEDSSVNTMENLLNSRRLIEADWSRRHGSGKGTGSPRIALVTSSYHVMRALSYAGEIGLSCGGIGAAAARYCRPDAFIREFAAVHKEKRQLMLFIVGWLIYLLSLLAAVVGAARAESF